jgi:undecaprenyl-diphosphatase
MALITIQPTAAEKDIAHAIAAYTIWPPWRVLRTLAVMRPTTRVILLAHWASDVVAGFAAAR